MMIRTLVDSSGEFLWNLRWILGGGPIFWVQTTHKPKAELMLDEEDDTREVGKKKAHDTCYLKNDTWHMLLFVLVRQVKIVH